ncbi:MAG: hypothetical protein GY762_11925 [Proteobacteria bacterium]|nr:hypothetical protein [Pseudomonadota bacterium]
MRKLESAEPPVPMEQLKEMLTFGLLCELRVNLYHDLKKILGDRMGKDVHRQLYNMSSSRSAHGYLGGDFSMENIMKLELLNFPLLGFDVHVEVNEEDGRDVYYEHITRCPFWEYTKMKGIKEMPCDITCKYDSERAMKEGIGRWECLSRQADGKDECLFRIRPFRQFEKEDDIKKILFNRTRLRYKYTERFNDVFK